MRESPRRQKYKGGRRGIPVKSCPASNNIIATKPWQFAMDSCRSVIIFTALVAKYLQLYYGMIHNYKYNC
jgi:hypothetical protein